jgi:hypothetical protein
VVKTIEVFARPVRLSRPPIPALVPWIQRSRGQLMSIWSGACQSKSKLMSAAVRRAAPPGQRRSVQFRRRAHVIARITRHGQQLGLVKQIYPRIGGRDPARVLGL